ncbi:MAG: N-acetyltransferase [Bacteroidota bacterium]
MKPIIRAVRKEDVPHLKDVLDSIELFPSDMLDGMISNYFDDPKTEEIWFTATEDDRPLSIGFCAPEQLTEGTYNLYAIGVKSDLQGQGVGEKMMAYLEAQLSATGQRILIVETSGTDELALTRKFYEKLGYHKEAVIRDFWKDGDDKVIYWKKLKNTSND